MVRKKKCTLRAARADDSTTESEYLSDIDPSYQRGQVCFYRRGTGASLETKETIKQQEMVVTDP